MEGRMSFSEAKTLWDEWEIRILVLVSLFLQVFLMLFGDVRKRNVSGTIGLVLWFFYLMADFVAIYALGYLSHKQYKSGMSDDNHHLRAFWAPFLLLHLGGQDTITSFAIEDNELWTRQLLNLGSQVVLAVYVFSKLLLPGTELLVPGILMFIAGTVKYGERVWSLKSASMNSLRNSMVRTPVSGFNYTKFMEEYSSSRGAGLPVEIKVEMERRPDMEYSRLVLEAHGFFRTFRCLIVNLILSSQHRAKNQSFFLPLQWEQAYKVVEIELSLLYDILHTKAMLIGTICGRFLRFTTVLSTLTAFVLFTVRDKGRYDRADVLVTYVLFGGAIGLEIYAIGLIFFSFWTYVELECSNCRRLARASFTILKLLRPEKKPRWSNSMAQFNLIDYCMRDQPTYMSLLASSVGAKRFWDNFWYIKRKDVTEQLKELIFLELKNKVETILKKIRYVTFGLMPEEYEEYRKLGKHRGEWALRLKYELSPVDRILALRELNSSLPPNDYYEKFGWSVEREFDESVLLWHIATDLCYDYQKDNVVAEDNNNHLHSPKTSRAISNYMLFLLVMQPYMLEEGIGQTRFDDTCKEAKNLFRRWKEEEAKNLFCRWKEKAENLFSQGKKEEEAKKVLDKKYDVAKILNPKIILRLRKGAVGELTMSVLDDAWKLANGLLHLSSDERWELIGNVWVEMLCYAAGKCKGNFHAKHLSTGGELLTIVWLLMVHMGIGEQYREGHWGRLAQVDC